MILKDAMINFEKKEKKNIVESDHINGLGIYNAFDLFSTDYTEFNEEVEVYNNEIEQLNKYQKFYFAISNVGNKSATNIDVKIECYLEKNISLLNELEFNELKPEEPKEPESINEMLSSTIGSFRQNKKTEIPNVRMYNISSYQYERNTRWIIQFHIQNLKYNDVAYMYPTYILIPENSKTKAIQFSVTFTMQEPGILNEQKLVLKIRN